MKLLFSMQIIFALFAALAFTQLAAAQNDSTAPVTYTYKALNSPGATGTAAYAINNTGEIVGFISGGQCEVISTQTTCGFTYARGQFTYVACELEDATDFFDVNNNGEVVGVYAFGGGQNGLIWEGNESCFPLEGPSGGSLAEAFGVNDGGNVVGIYTDSVGNFQGFYYVGTTQAYTTIACPGWTNTRAYGINNAGIIVGDVGNSPSGPFSGMAYISGKCTIFNYPGASSTTPRGINNKNQVSGIFTGSSGTFGFVRTGSTYTEIDYPTSASTLAHQINDKGQIAGTYTDANSVGHGFVAIP